MDASLLKKQNTLVTFVLQLAEWRLASRPDSRTMVLKEVEDTQPTPERGSVTSSSELRHRETSGSDDEAGQTVPVLTEAEPGDSPSRPTPASKNLQKPSYSRMRELDMHAVSTSQDFLQFPAFQLVQHLTQRTHTDVEAAYVIFRWVTCQTINKHQAGQPEVDGATTSTLATFVAQLNQGVIDHSDLYSHLCRFANLETHKITGVVRHFTSQPAVQLCRLEKGSWSAVLLAGGWGLVDCSLGSRLWRQSQRSWRSRVVDADSDAKHDGSSQSSDSLGSESGLSNNFRASEDPSTSLNGAYVVSETSPDRHVTSSLCVTSEKQLQCSPQYFYFLPEPKLLVSSHLPDDPWWQLLPRAVSDSEFHAALLLKPQFHYMSVELTKPKALRETDLEEGTEIVWKLKGSGLRRFAFRLFCPDDSNISSEELTSYGFLENLPGRGEVRLKVGPPKSGRYVCEVYGAYLPTHGNHMMHMCSFELHFSRAAACPLQFPPNERLEWGPGAECMALGLRPLTHELGSVHVDEGQAEVAFLCSQRLLVTQKISVVQSSESPRDLTGSVVNFRDGEGKLRIFLRLPSPGDYVLKVYAKPESASGRCPLVCTYLVLCDSGLPCHIRAFPPVPGGKVGPSKAFYDFGMTVVCPRSTCIVMAPFSGKVAFVFHCQRQDIAELSCELQLQPGDQQPADLTEFVQQSSRGRETFFRLRLPNPGDYVFHLYGKSSEGEGHKYLLYSAIVECSVPCKDSLPLPRIAPSWQSRLELLSPLRKYLVKGSITQFALRALGVRDIVIVGMGTEQSFVPEDDFTNDKESTDRELQEVEERWITDKDRQMEEDESVIDKSKHTERMPKSEGQSEADVWTTWRCRVSVSDEQAGSAMNLCLLDEVSGGSYVCAAKFEVITERRMEETLDRQHQTWTSAEEEGRRRRPRSGLHVQAAQDAEHAIYFRDDELYVSNPLGDDSSDDSFNDSSDDQDEDYAGSDVDGDDDPEIRENSYEAVKGTSPCDSVIEGEKTPDKDSDARSDEQARQQMAPASLTRATVTPAPIKSKTEKSKLKPGNGQAKRFKNIYGSSPRGAAGSQRTKKGMKNLEGRQPASTRDSKSSKEQPGNDRTQNNTPVKVDKHYSSGAVRRDEETSNQLEGRRQRVLRRRLWNACQRRQREDIQRAVARYERGGYPPCADLAEAKRLLVFFQLRDALVEAIECKDPERINNGLRDVELGGFGGDLAALCKKARSLLNPHKGQNKLLAVAEADVRTLLEIRGYRCPPEVVHHVVIATLLLLGVHEGLTKKWRHCQRRVHVLGPHGIHRKMLTIEPDCVHPEIAARAKVLLEEHSLQEANSAGPAVAAVLRWAMDVIKSVEEAASEAEGYFMMEEARQSVQAASRQRQKQIFRQQAQLTSGEQTSGQKSAHAHRDHRGMKTSQPKTEDRGKSSRSSSRHTPSTTRSASQKRSSTKADERKSRDGKRPTTVPAPQISRNRDTAKRNPNVYENPRVWDKGPSVGPQTRGKSREKKVVQTEKKNLAQSSKTVDSDQHSRQPRSNGHHLQPQQQQQSHDTLQQGPGLGSTSQPELRDTDTHDRAPRTSDSPTDKDKTLAAASSQADEQDCRSESRPEARECAEQEVKVGKQEVGEDRSSTSHSAGFQPSLKSPSQASVSSQTRPRRSEVKGGERPTSRALGSRKANPKAPQPIIFHSSFYPISNDDDDAQDRHNGYT